MEGHADHVEEDRVLQIHALGNLHQHGVLHVTDQHVGGVAAVGAADAGGTGETVDADVGLALTAGGAVLGAVGRRTAEDHVADLIIGNTLADFHYGAHVLVAKDHGELNKGRHRTGLIEFHICAADAHVVDLHDQLVGAGGGHGPVNDPDVLLSIQCDCFHN